MAKPRPLLGLFAGVAAGLIASAAMAAFQEQAQKMLSDEGGEDGKAQSPALLGGSRDRLVKTPAGWRFSERIGFLDLRIA